MRLQEESQANPDASTLRVRSAARVRRAVAAAACTLGKLVAWTAWVPCELLCLQVSHQEDEETSTSAEESCSYENLVQKRLTLRALAEAVLAKV